MAKRPKGDLPHLTPSPLVPSPALPAVRGPEWSTQVPSASPPPPSTAHHHTTVHAGCEAAADSARPLPYRSLLGEHQPPVAESSATSLMQIGRILFAPFVFFRGHPLLSITFATKKRKRRKKQHQKHGSQRHSSRLAAHQSREGRSALTVSAQRSKISAPKSVGTK